jgi:hypothetical protein
MMDRIIRAITFKTDVYTEVANDASFTQSAWIIVVVSQFLSQLGGRAALLPYNGFFSYVLGVIVGTAFGVGAFALGVFVIVWLAKALFNTSLTFEQLQRPLGLASVFSVIGILGIFSAFSLSLLCISAPVTLIVAVAGFVAYLYALKKVTALDWGKVAVLVVADIIVSLIISAIVGSIFAVSALTTAALY